ncbi:MAG: hypothetical protein JXR94_14255 [Candidatus Hydrogenedentes bacterium]|nr:hypothetical protein [Candidatus Hydrogenedentota bacterium]
MRERSVVSGRGYVPALRWEWLYAVRYKGAGTEEKPMQLTDIDLGGLGAFLEEPAAFRIDTPYPPRPWDYVYANDRALLRVNHDGTGYFQLDPPCGPALFKMERLETAPPPFLVWIVTDWGNSACRAFTNFGLPVVPFAGPAAFAEYETVFAPDAARFTVCHDGLRVRTELCVAESFPGLVMGVAVCNTGRRPRTVRVVPAWRPHVAPFAQAPWDVPHWYQRCAVAKSPRPLITVEKGDPAGDPAQRLRAFFTTNLPCRHACVSEESFIGRGLPVAPESIGLPARGSWLPLASALPPGRYGAGNASIGTPPHAAFLGTLRLNAGQEKTFSVAAGFYPATADGSWPSSRPVSAAVKGFEPKGFERERGRTARRYRKLFGHRSINTPDAALNRYANEWLPLQLDWVCRLDRGWPSGMRGTRDAAQDFTGLVPLDPGAARARLLELFNVMRSDGWFPRQYSVAGREGPHDLRAYMDSGWWVWELLYEYLVHTRDFDVLAEPATYLDAEGTGSVLDHVCAMMRFALRAENQGEHGLLKIREGDWNDSVNGAGVLERGETVMASAQVVLALEQAGELLRYLADTGRVPKEALRQTRRTAGAFEAGAAAMAGALLTHARNRAGYFNGVFSDGGAWCFSPRDPDGRRRINTPANSFAVIAGLVDGAEREAVFEALDEIRTETGWLVFGPAIGAPPIAHLGRIGSGDLPAGMLENGASYNHGCHGFLGRACWVAGKGGMLYDTLRYLLPYDQEAHPVAAAKAAPYAVPNHWRNVPGSVGEAGATFLSGSISTGLRNVWHGLIGFRPGLHGLVIDPCIPRNWQALSATASYLGKRLDVRIENPDGNTCGVRHLELEGERFTPNARFRQGHRDVVSIPWERIAAVSGARGTLRVRL